jgi:hypothetical protein
MPGPGAFCPAAIPASPLRSEAPRSPVAGDSARAAGMGGRRRLRPPTTGDAGARGVPPTGAGSFGHGVLRRRVVPPDGVGMVSPVGTLVPMPHRSRTAGPRALAARCRHGRTPCALGCGCDGSARPGRAAQSGATPGPASGASTSQRGAWPGRPHPGPIWGPLRALAGAAADQRACLGSGTRPRPPQGSRAGKRPEVESPGRTFPVGRARRRRKSDRRAQPRPSLPGGTACAFGCGSLGTSTAMRFRAAPAGLRALRGALPVRGQAHASGFRMNGTERKREEAV